MRKDGAAIAANMADDFRQIDSDGDVETKASFIAGLLAPDLQIDPYTVEDFEVRLYADTALLSGRTRMTGSYRGKPFASHYRYIDIYVRSGGVWKIVSVQTTRLAKYASAGRLRGRGRTVGCRAACEAPFDRPRLALDRSFDARHQIPAFAPVSDACREPVLRVAEHRALGAGLDQAKRNRRPAAGRCPESPAVVAAGDAHVLERRPALRRRREVGADHHLAARAEPALLDDLSVLAAAPVAAQP